MLREIVADMTPALQKKVFEWAMANLDRPDLTVLKDRLDQRGRIGLAESLSVYPVIKAIPLDQPEFELNWMFDWQGHLDPMWFSQRKEPFKGIRLFLNNLKATFLHVFGGPVKTDITAEMIIEDFYQTSFPSYIRFKPQGIGTICRIPMAQPQYGTFIDYLYCLAEELEALKQKDIKEVEERFEEATSKTFTF